jgi:PIN domain nuclease of toxin-antitoxin system
MRLLLDTHMWLWSAMDPRKLKSNVARELGDERNELFLSPISIWELRLLMEKKKFSIGMGLEAWLEHSREFSVLREAPLTWDVAREERGLGWSHKDPADRFLAATARVYGLTLVTADQRLANAPGIEVLWNG